MRRLSRRAIRQFLLYNVGGAAFFVVGYGLFALLYGVFGLHWLAAKLIADAVGWVVNYLVQRHLTFVEESKHHRERVLIGKFTFISLVNVPLDYLIVGGLNWLGISPFIGLLVSSGFFTIWKYLWYKHYVFRKKPAVQ